KFPKMTETMGHVLELALRGLSEKSRRVLQTIVAFRMAVTYDTLAAVLVGDNRVCGNERDLDEVLNELEDRGLLGWDKRANRYHIHPIVRGIVWAGLDDQTRKDAYANLFEYFEKLPEADNYLKV